ncbi:MAG TPA: hypothetical protein VHE59_06885 [Mucilaginibacter sp.]|nr:hypothetical protein [Mucilaginibacter sp.]
MNSRFEPIDDAYELAEGSIIKGKEQDELFQLGEYDPDKKGYQAHPYENGRRMDDFAVLITESELMENYLVEMAKGDREDVSTDNLPSDGAG